VTVRRLLLVAATLCCLGAAGLPSCARRQQDALPTSLSDQAFWQIVDSVSEPGGYFRSDNLLSNEDTFQQVIPTLQHRVPRDRVYLGVGPEQNFSYIVELEPRMAFVLDIRRQNLLLHLLYKALIERSADRAEFLSRLFSRPRPSTLSTRASVQELFDTYRLVEASPELFRTNLEGALTHLAQAHGFPLSNQDRASIQYVYQAFYDGGPDLRYAMPRPFGGGRFFPSYADLLSGTDASGTARSYLADEGRFATLKRYEQRNLIVPLVGDFAGPHALQALGRYLRTRGSTVGVFYTSNVEQYLFQQTGGWMKFAENMRALPADDRSMILRSRFLFGIGDRGLGTTSFGSRRSVMVFDVIPDLLRAERNNEIHSYRDVLERAETAPVAIAP
jgi:hypothetical protein